MLWTIPGFLVGCVVWNYFGPVLKGWLHIGERDAGAAIVSGVQKAEDKIKSKL